ncbi:unnamed protein product, partial [Ixodes hexagonus]
EASEVFVDGTFFSCPSLFYQMLTISVVKERCSFNVAYFLRPGKSRDVYVQAFEHCRAALTDLNLSVSFDLVRTDFELALIQAILFVFPGARHRGCHFHFSQAIWRKVQELGLSKAYRLDTSVAGFVRKMISLAFVPPNFQWNQHQNRGARTNNLKEAWHRKINNMVGKAHPNLFAFVDLLKKDEATSRVSLL